LHLSTGARGVQTHRHLFAIDLHIRSTSIDLIEATATVEAVDVDNRLVTLKCPEGRLVTIKAGEEVKNLPQIDVGDKYY
jgi:hypothetical protein